MPFPAPSTALRMAVPAVLVLSLACGRNGRLSRSEAERDIRKDYPVTVMLRVPEKAVVPKDSEGFRKLTLLQQKLGERGWFTCAAAPEGDRVRFTFTPTGTAPRETRLSARGEYQVPAAQAEFVRALRIEPMGQGAKVTYTVRMVKPTPAFPVFLALYPKASVGSTTERHAMYRKEGKDWILQDTDDPYRRQD